MKKWYRQGQDIDTPELELGLAGDLILLSKKKQQCYNVPHYLIPAERWEKLRELVEWYRAVTYKTSVGEFEGWAANLVKAIEALEGGT